MDLIKLISSSKNIDSAKKPTRGQLFAKEKYLAKKNSDISSPVKK